MIVARAGPYSDLKKSVSRQVTSCLVTSFHFMSCQVMLCHVKHFDGDFGCFQDGLSNLLRTKAYIGNLINGSLGVAR